LILQVFSLVISDFAQNYTEYSLTIIADKLMTISGWWWSWWC